MKTLLIPALVLSQTGLAQAQSATYAADPLHTFVLFEAKHAGTSTNRGRFFEKEASITIDQAAKTGTAEITIDTTSISTGVAALDTNLKSKNFFNAAEFPTAKFVGDKFTFDGAKVTSVAGQLTLLGKSLPVTLTSTSFNCYDHPMLKRQVCGGDFETTIVRSQWGMDYGLKYGLPDSIHLLIQIEGVKQ